MEIVTQWLPLLAALGAPLLAWFLLAGRRDLRRAALLAALAATLALVALLVTAFAVVQTQQQVPPNADLFQSATDVARMWVHLTDVLALAAWTLLLAAATMAGDRGRLAGLAVVFTLALALQVAMSDPSVPLLAWLRQWLSQLDLAVGASISVALAHVAAIPALVCAALASTDAASTPTGAAA